MKRTLFGIALLALCPAFAADQDFNGRWDITAMTKPRPRAWAVVALASSWADHYATAAMYLRLNNLLPPTAQKPKADEKKPGETKK